MYKPDKSASHALSNAITMATWHAMACTEEKQTEGNQVRPVNIVSVQGCTAHEGHTGHAVCVCVGAGGMLHGSSLTTAPKLTDTSPKSVIRIL